MAQRSFTTLLKPGATHILLTSDLKNMNNFFKFEKFYSQLMKKFWVKVTIPMLITSLINSLYQFQAFMKCPILSGFEWQFLKQYSPSFGVYYCYWTVLGVQAQHLTEVLLTPHMGWGPIFLFFFHFFYDIGACVELTPCEGS